MINNSAKKASYKSRVLAEINNSRRPLNISDIASRLEVTRVTAHRWATRLAEEGLINSEKTDYHYWFSKLGVEKCD